MHTQQATPTTNQPAQLILRDIHLPHEVSWWPPAVGWWLLLGALSLIIITVLLIMRRRRQRRYQRIALKQLAAWEQGLTQGEDPQLLLQKISQLLRHMAVLHYPTKQCAGLHDQEWLQFLDNSLAGGKKQRQPFSNGIGRCLISAPYQRAEQAETLTPDQLKELIQLSRQWLKTLPLPTTQRRSA